MPSTLTTALAGIALALMCLVLGECHGERRGATATRNEMLAEFNANVAVAYKDAATKQAAEYVRANALAVELINAKRTIETERTTLRGRIVHVTREIAADCGLPDAAVRLWNEAWGLPASGVSEALRPGGAAGQAAAPGSAGSGVQPGASIADALAWQIDAGAYCRGIEAQRDQLQELVRGWAQ